MRRTRVLFFFCALSICALAMPSFGEDPVKPTVSKPGAEVKPLELESARLGKLKAQLLVLTTQQTLLQQQYNQLLAEAGRTQAKLDALVKEIQMRMKKEQALDVTYDQTVGEDGIFHVVPNAPVPAPSTP